MLFLMLTLMLVSEPQEPSDEPTRAEESRIVRESKAQNLRAPNRTALEKALYEFRERRIMERFQNGLFGLHPLLGGMHTGSGFALGTSYLKDGFRSSGQISFKGYQRVEAGFSAPRLVTDRLFADVHAAYKKLFSRRLLWHGQQFANRGPDELWSRRLELRGQIGVRLKDHVKTGVDVSWTQTHIGVGTDSRFPTLGSVSDSKDLPALLAQPEYLQSSAFLEMDNRDRPGNPRAGGRYVAKWSSFHDRNRGRYDFTQYDIEAQHYFPFFNQRSRNRVPLQYGPECVLAPRRRVFARRRTSVHEVWSRLLRRAV